MFSAGKAAGSDSTVRSLAWQHSSQCDRMTGFTCSAPTSPRMAPAATSKTDKRTLRSQENDQMMSSQHGRWVNPRPAPQPPSLAVESTGKESRKIEQWAWRRPSQSSLPADRRLQADAKETTRDLDSANLPVILPRDESIGCLAQRPRPSKVSARSKSSVPASESAGSWPQPSSTLNSSRSGPQSNISTHLIQGSILESRSEHHNHARCLSEPLSRSLVSLVRNDPQSAVRKPDLPKPLIPVYDDEMEILMATGLASRRRLKSTSDASISVRSGTRHSPDRQSSGLFTATSTVSHDPILRSQGQLSRCRSLTQLLSLNRPGIPRNKQPRISQERQVASMANDQIVNPDLAQKSEKKSGEGKAVTSKAGPFFPSCLWNLSDDNSAAKAMSPSSQERARHWRWASGDHGGKCHAFSAFPFGRGKLQTRSASDLREPAKVRHQGQCNLEIKEKATKGVPSAQIPHNKSPSPSSDPTIGYPLDSVARDDTHLSAGAVERVDALTGANGSISTSVLESNESFSPAAAWSRSETDLHLHYDSYQAITSRADSSRSPPFDLDDLLEDYKRGRGNSNSRSDAVEVGVAREVQTSPQEHFKISEPTSNVSIDSHPFRTNNAQVQGALAFCPNKTSADGNRVHTRSEQTIPHPYRFPVRRAPFDSTVSPTQQNLTYSDSRSSGLPSPKPETNMSQGVEPSTLTRSLHRQSHSTASSSSDASVGTDFSRFGFPSILDVNRHLDSRTHNLAPDCTGARGRSESLDSAMSSTASIATHFTGWSAQDPPYNDNTTAPRSPFPPSTSVSKASQGHRRLKSSIDMLDNVKMDTIGE